jgi:hypothetical protein
LTKNDADEIKDLLNEKLEQLVDHFWKGNVKHGGKIAYCAPVDRKDLGTFVVYLKKFGKYPRGSWMRSSQGIGGDELNLFAYGYTGQHRATAEVFQAAREWLGLDNRRPETPEERRKREDREAAAIAKREADEKESARHQAERQRSAEEDWMDSGPLAGTQGEAYFFDRGLVMPPEGWGESLRFHGRLVYDLDRRLSFPGIICRVDDAFGDLTAVWKIYLDPKKPAKAPVENAKIGAGVAAGGAVRLGGIGPHIGIGEGVETCIAARALIEYRYPVWPALSTAGVAGFECPIEVEHITGFPDGDKPWRRQNGDLVLAEPAGRACMRKLRERIAAIEKRFDAQPEPRLRQDYLNIWNARRRAEEMA